MMVPVTLEVAAFVATCIVAIVSSAWLVCRRNSSSRRLVPQVAGWPILGSLPAFSRSPTDFIESNRAVFGETFSATVLRQS
jgi:hypothetical protein